MSSSFLNMILDTGGGRHGHHVCVRSIVTAIPNGERRNSESSHGGGTVRAAGQPKPARWQDGKGGGGRRRSARRVRCSRWRRQLRQVRVDADGQGTRAGAATMACNQIIIYKIKK